MIPKKLHYCWFGGSEYPPLVRDCIKTWTKYLSDYEWIKWDESNSPMSHPMVKKAIKQKKWAFAADYVRMYALYHYGGLYLDTDMEVIKDISVLLTQKGFLGYEDNKFINAGVIAVKKESEFIKSILNIFDSRMNQNLPFVPIPEIINQAVEQLKDSEELNNISIYPPEYFYPYNPFANDRKELLFSDITENTYAIHHWCASWVEEPPLWRIVGSRVKKSFLSINNKG